MRNRPERHSAHSRLANGRARIALIGGRTLFGLSCRTKRPLGLNARWARHGARIVNSRHQIITGEILPAILNSQMPYDPRLTLALEARLKDDLWRCFDAPIVGQGNAGGFDYSRHDDLWRAWAARGDPRFSLDSLQPRPITLNGRGRLNENLACVRNGPLRRCCTRRRQALRRQMSSRCPKPWTKKNRLPERPP